MTAEYGEYWVPERFRVGIALMKGKYRVDVSKIEDIM